MVGSPFRYVYHIAVEMMINRAIELTKASNKNQRRAYAMCLVEYTLSLPSVLTYRCRNTSPRSFFLLPRICKRVVPRIIFIASQNCNHRGPSFAWKKCRTKRNRTLHVTVEDDRMQTRMRRSLPHSHSHCVHNKHLHLPHSHGHCVHDKHLHPPRSHQVHLRPRNLVDHLPLSHRYFARNQKCLILHYHVHDARSRQVHLRIRSRLV